MGEIKTIHYIVGVLLGSMLMMGMFSFVIGGAEHYNTTIDDRYQTYFNTYNETAGNMSTLVTSMQEDIEAGESSGVSGLAAADYLIMAGKAALSAIKSVFISLTSITTILSDTAVLLGLPTWFVNPLLAIIVIVLVFLVIGLILRYKE